MSAQRSTPFPDLPQIGIKFPHSPVTVAAFEYTKQHTTEDVYNHCVRSAYFALLLVNKLPQLSPNAARRAASLETIVLACIMHDMGWATTPELISKDKRFEVDGANVAKDWLLNYQQSAKQGEANGSADNEWDEQRVTVLWNAIALHTTPSIAGHSPSPEVVLAHLGIVADFLGPNFPPGNGAVITPEEYKAVEAQFPFAGFGVEGCKKILCGLCRDKPETTYDNFMASFGMEYGVDGKGEGKEAYKKAWEENQMGPNLLASLAQLEELVKKN
ncbi:hypothetical protein F4778DRAFT_748322 [Xylariomycetidae sp. FL2044]|nr:hypothetical protein F4778DRAFT_748322 [Xylariomycetidae sp. FL2044]